GPTWFGLVAASLVVVIAAAWIVIPIDPAIDAGTNDGRQYLYSGFSSDEREGDTTYAWVNGTRAELLIPRRSRRDAVIDLVCQPHLATATSVQQLSASLNGTVI